MKRADLFILGKGGVAAAFFNLFPAFQKRLGALGWDIGIVGAADRTSAVIDREGQFADLLSAVKNKNLQAHAKSFAYGSPENLSGRLKSLGDGLIVLDLSSGENSLFFGGLLSSGLAVVTANKKPLASVPAEFENLKPYCNNRLRYEATVGGGLPILSTLARLMRSGDEIVDVRGIFSGTMSFIFNEVNTGKTFSECVREAHALGFTEPDPRDDLSGADVARKAIILARTLGARLNPEYVEAESLVPEELSGATVAEFLKEISLSDSRYKRTEKMGYVATATPYDARVSLEPLSAGDPLYTLSGAENMAVIRTKKYFNHPLVIRGPGAGADVTAQGVAGDILRVLGAL